MGVWFAISFPPDFNQGTNSFLCLLLSLSRFLDRHFGFLWRFPLTTRSQTSVPRSPLPAPRSPFPVLVTSPNLPNRLSLLPKVFFCALATTVQRVKNLGLSLNRQIIKIHTWFQGSGKNNEINELPIIESQCDIFPFALLNLWTSYEFNIRYWSKMEAKGNRHYIKTWLKRWLINNWTKSGKVLSSLNC